MKRPPLWPFFCISLFFMFYVNARMPAATFFPFVPFLLMAFGRFSFTRSLYLAALTGLMIDLFTLETPLGFYALSDVTTTCLLYRFRHFFVEKGLGLSGFTAFFSTISTGVQKILFLFFGIALPFTWQGALTDFLLMPLFDGCYAFLWFSCPLLLYHFMRKQWFRFLFLRKEAKQEKGQSHG